MKDRILGRGHPPADNMTLRDWFAGMALAECPDPINEEDAGRTARIAYAIADAMMLERDAVVSSYTASRMAQIIVDRAEVQLTTVEGTDGPVEHARRVRETAARLHDLLSGAR